MLALALSGCDSIDDDDDDDDCALGPADRGRAIAAALPASALAAAMPASTGTRTDLMPAGGRSGEPAGAVPERGGFGTHLASCGG